MAGLAYGSDGYTTVCRVPAPKNPAVRDERAERNRTARANLAAMACEKFGVDPACPDPSRAAVAAAWFAEVADLLGLREAAQ